MKALFFSPFSNIWEHNFPEALIAESLQQNGMEIVTVKCDGVFGAFCVAMSASGLNDFASDKQKAQVCRACRKRRDLLENSFPFTSIISENYLSEDDYAAAREVVSTATLENWSHLSYQGRPLGKYAAYEFLLNFKILGTDIPENLFPKYLEHLNNAVLSFIAAGNILDEQQPDVVLTYNRLYGVNHAFLDVAEQRGITTYSLQGGGHITHRGETMTLFRDSETQFQLVDSPTWREFSSHPISELQTDLAVTHLYGLMEGSSAFVYSSAYEASDPAQLREQLSVPQNKPLILVPLSSEDELNAAQLADLLPDTSHRVNLFDGQLDWLEYVIQFARENNQFHFVLRLHPRMFPNKRESVLAPILARVQQIISHVPENVTINVPDDNVSIYDLLQITHLVLGYRSSVGAEFAAFGIPVVTPANQYFYTYPDELHRVSLSLEDYNNEIHRAISDGWSIEQTRMTFRWYAFLFSRICVDLSGSVNSKPSSLRPKKPGLRLFLWRKLVYLIIQFGPLIRERMALRNRSLDPTAAAIINDVINNSLTSTAVSLRWGKEEISLSEETQRIRQFYEALLAGPWKEISDEKSLAQTIRNYLATN